MLTDITIIENYKPYAPPTSGAPTDMESFQFALDHLKVEIIFGHSDESTLEAGNFKRICESITQDIEKRFAHKIVLESSGGLNIC